MFGYDKDEFSNLNLKDYTSPKSYEEVFARHKKRMSGVDVPKEFEYEGIRKDGTTIYIAAKVNLIKENGKIVGTQSLERDITARKQSETELQENKQENDILAAALRNINDCVTITDDKNNLIFVNDSFLKVYGYCKDEVIGKNIKMVILRDMKVNTDKTVQFHLELLLQSQVLQYQPPAQVNPKI